VHRDIKPENIMYRNPSPTSPIVIVDFGIAKFIDNLTDADGYSDDESGSDDDTRAAQAAPGPVVLGEEQADSKMAGTFGYASPEALQGKRPACKMDMWSIGYVYSLRRGGAPSRRDLEA
jgi:calcium/calmodulin-dependent protein kinase I